ncbi:MAG: YbfB/YjiJ family MFS transporter [Desulfuromonadaceae bacterium]|nr:YbfB/YjiJ family MFS transporter [Desulfuromonadaceae bacterium]
MINEQNNNNHAETNPQPALRVLIGGMLGMMVAMGIGRFAFTPILPLMQRDLGVSHSLAGWLASLNYVGYLAGALLCAVRPRLLRSASVNVGALVASISTTVLMGLTTSPFWWGALRLTAGFTSALLFVVIAIEVSETLVRSRHSRWSSALYGGIGLGIALSGSFVPFLDRLGGWSVTWLGMGLMAVLLALAGITVAGKRHGAVGVPDGTVATTGALTGISRLATAYFLEGVGYIVSATFLVTMIAHTPGLGEFAPWSWVAVGLAAAPSTIFWQLTASRIGVRPALTLAYLLQSIGIFLSINAGSVLRAGLAAVIFGGTFLGIVALAMSEGARRAGSEGRRATAVLTACFGAGQVVGPPLAGFLADQHGGFSLSLLLTGVLVVLGGILVATDRGFSIKAVSNNS